MTHIRSYLTLFLSVIYMLWTPCINLWGRFIELKIKCHKPNFLNQQHNIEKISNAESETFYSFIKQYWLTLNVMAALLCIPFIIVINVLYSGVYSGVSSKIFGSSADWCGSFFMLVSYNNISDTHYLNTYCLVLCSQTATSSSRHYTCAVYHWTRGQPIPHQEIYRVWVIGDSTWSQRRITGGNTQRWRGLRRCQMGKMFI